MLEFNACGIQYESQVVVPVVYKSNKKEIILELKAVEVGVQSPASELSENDGQEARIAHEFQRPFSEGWDYEGYPLSLCGSVAKTDAYITY